MPSSSSSSSLPSWEKEMERARRGHRPSLKDWKRDGLHETFPAFVRSLQEQQQQQSNTNENHIIHCMTSLIPSSSSSSSLSNDDIIQHPSSLPVILDAETLDINFFTSTLEKKGIPCLIHNIPKVEGWRCNNSSSNNNTNNNSWELSSLLADDNLRNRKFKCGEDDDGHSIKVKLKYFLQYLNENRDDSPLYIFDSTFDDDRKAKKLLDDYKVPSLFQDDLFRLVSESRRPPYRWFLVGPERSGTTVHIDPLATSAWNTLLVGKKRWVLFPPQVPKSIAKGKHYVYKHEDDEAIHYFMTILPRIKRAAVDIEFRNKHHSKDNASVLFHNFACYEFTQNAGDTVFIPNGWWHGVLNLTHTVGITQNFCSPRNFPQVWKKTRSGRKLLAAKWMNSLEAEPQYKYLAKLARQMNKRDNYIMKYNPEIIRRQDEVKKEKKKIKEQQQQQKKKQQKQEDNNCSSSDDDEIASASASAVSKNNNREHKRSRLDSSPNSVVVERRNVIN